MEGSKPARRKNGSFELFGTGLTICIALIFVLIYGVAIFQHVFWKDLWYAGTFNLKDACQVATTVNAKKSFPKFEEQAFRSVSLPHHLESVLPRAISPKQYGHALYKCAVPANALGETLGATYVSLGFVYGDEITVAVNGTERAFINRDTRIFVPLNSGDLNAETIRVTVAVTSSFDDLLGFTGQAPVVITRNRTQAEKLFGQEAMYNHAYYLHHILPTLALSIFLILIWFKGIRSRILVSTFFYFCTNALFYLIPVIISILPGGIDRLRSLKSIFGSLPELALLILACEFLGVGRKYLRFSHLAVTLIIACEALVVATAENHFNIGLQHFRTTHIIIFVAAVAALALYYFTKLKESYADESIKKLSLCLVVILSASASAVLIDTVSWHFFSFQPGLALNVNLFIPIGIGIVVAQNIALIQQQYQMERLKREKMESDLDLAREIQDSLALPPPETSFAGMKVSCFQIKHSQVAGDWMAVRQCGEDEMIVLVADVTGKGVQAALVVHAIQSLWAEALEETFEPELWLTKVNRTLFRLGERRPHSATMGLLSIKADRLRYWCMGHTPLFIVLDEGDAKQRVKALISRGGILGVSPETAVEYQDFELSQGIKFDLLLGSDGVFDKGSRTKPREVTEFLTLVKNEGYDSLVGRDDNDDRTLVYVHSAA